MKAFCLAACALLGVAAIAEAGPVPRRALLIGIGDYSASRLGPVQHPTPPGRTDWADLEGPPNDVATMREMLILLYGFAPGDIVTISNQDATRARILEAIERHLVQPAAKGALSFFYYAGHGSQVRNSRSAEPDRMDETLVPADSRLGVPDIRDKELRPLFNRILDRGAKLTIVLDNCHSGSGARGLFTGAQPRSVKPDLRDIADDRNYGPAPEDRGALVISATDDDGKAWETHDDETETMHGAFSHAWVAAMRDSLPDEPAQETFLRARAILRAGKPYQNPVLSGTAAARATPFLGSRRDRAAGGRTLVAVKDVRDGTVLLEGGWAHGLALGTRLVLADSPHITTGVVVTDIRSLGQSEARVEKGRVLPKAIRSGALMEVVAWAAPPGRPLRVCIPRMQGGPAQIARLARQLHEQASRRDLWWIADPVDETPTYLLHRAGPAWELIGPNGRKRYGDPVLAVAEVPRGSSLFVQLPAPFALIDGIAVDGVEPVERAEDADYVLAGRYANRAVTYAWVRPSTKDSDRRHTGLPPRTTWIAGSAAELRDQAVRLRRIHGWHQLESPAGWRSPYRLEIRRKRSNKSLAESEALIGEDSYELVLRADPDTLSPDLRKRHFYAFAIDSHGKGILLFPSGAQGSVENEFPLDSPPPSEIRLGDPGSFEVRPPYGLDTFFLLTTEEPLSTPWILEWDGVLARSPRTELERLLMLTISGTRGTSLVAPSNWSIEKVTFESVAPKRGKG